MDGTEPEAELAGASPLAPPQEEAPEEAGGAADPDAQSGEAIDNALRAEFEALAPEAQEALREQARARVALATKRQEEAEAEAAAKKAAAADAAAAAAAAGAPPALEAPPGDAAADGKKKRRPVKKDKEAKAEAPKLLPSSGYHGVVRKSSGCFQAKALAGRKVICIGSFTTAESAARSYDTLMRRLQRAGDGGGLNFGSDMVAWLAAGEAECRVLREGGSKACRACGRPMAVRLKVCRACRASNGTRSAFRGVRAKSGTVASGDGELPAKYQAFLWHDKTNEYLGTFHTEEEAALAYDDRFRALHGDAPAATAAGQLNWPNRADGVAAAEAARARMEAAHGGGAPLPPIATKKRKPKGAAAADAAGAAAGAGAAGAGEEPVIGGDAAGAAAGDAPPKTKKAKAKRAAATPRLLADLDAGAAAHGGYDGAGAALMSLAELLPPPPPPAQQQQPAAAEEAMVEPPNIFAALGIE